MEKLFIAIDGDNVGANLEYLILMNDIKVLTDFSNNFQEAMDWLIQRSEDAFAASVLFFGGDNVLFEVSEDNFDNSVFEDTRQEFITQTGKTLSIGIGSTPRQAYFALKLAKSSGKNCIKWYKDM